MTNAAPRPWRVTHDIYKIWSGDDYLFGVFDNEANARLIVTAVNAHDALVAACRLALKEIEDLEAFQRETGYFRLDLAPIEDDPLPAMLRDALALAEATP